MSLRDLNLVPIVAHDMPLLTNLYFLQLFYVLREKITWISLCTIEDNSLPVFLIYRAPNYPHFPYYKSSYLSQIPAIFLLLL